MLDVKASRFYTTPLTTPPSKPDAKPTQRRYHYLDHRPPPGVPERATLLLLHGFPDFSEGWRSVIAPLRLAGFRLIIPDLLGYVLPRHHLPPRLLHLLEPSHDWQSTEAEPSRSTSMACWITLRLRRNPNTAQNTSHPTARRVESLCSAMTGDRGWAGGSRSGIQIG